MEGMGKIAALLEECVKIGITAEKLVEMQNIINYVTERHQQKIYQGKDGRWYTYTKQDGTRKKVVKRTEAELIEWLYEYYHGAELTLRTLYPEWLEYKKLQAASDSYPLRIESDWKRFYEGDPIIDVPLSQLTALLLEEFVLKAIKTNALTKTAYYNMSIILRQSLDYAVKRGEITCNPFSSVLINTQRLLQKQRKKDDAEQVFAPDEVISIERLAWEDYGTPGKKIYRLAPLAVVFCFQTGLRVGELTGLRFEDVDNCTLHIRRMVRKDDHVVIEHTKTTAGMREVPLTQKAREIIAVCEAFSPGGWIFSEHSQPLPSRIVEEYFAKYCAAIGTPQKSTHCARKTYVSALIDAGININTVKTIVGHTDARTTLGNYTFDRLHAEQLERIERALNSER